MRLASESCETPVRLETAATASGSPTSDSRSLELEYDGAIVGVERERGNGHKQKQHQWNRDFFHKRLALRRHMEQLAAWVPDTCKTNAGLRSAAACRRLQSGSKLPHSKG